MEEIIEGMTENEYVSIAKFADLAGITKQAVYQRLNKDLLNYVKVDGKVKMVSTAAIPLFAAKLNAKEQSIESPIEQADVKVGQENLKLIEYLKAENEQLKQQIEEKDAIIAKKDEIIIGYADRFATIAEREQELTRNAQQLHAMLALGPGKNEEENAPEPESTVEKKKSFLGIFKKKQKKIEM